MSGDLANPRKLPSITLSTILFLVNLSLGIKIAISVYLLAFGDKMVWLYVTWTQSNTIAALMQILFLTASNGPYKLLQLASLVYNSSHINLSALKVLDTPAYTPHFRK